MHLKTTIKCLVQLNTHPGQLPIQHNIVTQLATYYLYRYIASQLVIPSEIRNANFVDSYLMKKWISHPIIESASMQIQLTSYKLKSQPCMHVVITIQLVASYRCSYGQLNDQSYSYLQETIELLTIQLIIANSQFAIAACIS